MNEKSKRKPYIYIYIYIALALVLGCFINNFVTTNEGVLANEEDAPRVDVGIELKIKKTDPEGKPLKGVKFKLHNGTYETDEKGEVSIPTYKHPDGFAALIEEGQVIEGAEYEAKAINLNIKERCYDEVCFNGEVKGNDFITYSKLKTEIETDGNKIGNLSDLGNDKDDDGNWLKFTDYKYTKDGKPRVFYVSKKPITNNVSWNDLYKAGVIYGTDIVDDQGKINDKLDSNKLDEESSWYTSTKFTKDQYTSKFTTIGGKKYVVRLLRGSSNYSQSIYGPSNIYKYYKENQFSEWNRVILSITKNYRAGSTTFNNKSLEPALREGVLYGIPADDYKVQLGRYNWFGDLTLGADEGYQYEGQFKFSVGYQGQSSWCQEFFDSAFSRTIRGDCYTHTGAANSSMSTSSYKDSTLGFRPVLEEVPLEYDGMIFDGEVKGTDFITYKDLKTQVESGGKKVGDTLELGNDEADGGNWLKFTDTKYKNNGKPRVFYIAKKPVTNKVSWDDLFAAGVVYGPDKINSDGSVKTEAIEIKPGYKGKIVTVKGKRYIVRLMRGVSNGDTSVRYKSGTTDYDYDDARNSEWNRSIVAVTKQYRGEADSMEQALKDGNPNYKYVNNNYKVQLHNYNWFGDLTLGASQNYQYDGKSMSSVGWKGQYSWCQEYISDFARFVRGDSHLSYGAAYSRDKFSSYRDAYCGWRPVLELVD